ncbi:ATP-binding cassette domain-containing protein [Thiomicrorhabdus sp.]|uniref:ABC transporter ATP-binding protein n=1 Tax=Thiomicrorhabdus sp. TaxID=2039724 RepID=UPI0029C96C61|nr:ATP-binding cassette domain-containing protein [Thiomicrorhabdus sp.]
MDRDMGPELLRIDGLLTDGMPEAVDLRVCNRQVWMLSGVSGSGKSRFLKALADLVVHSGSARLQGQSMNAMSAESWRRKVMYFSAETAWWSDRVEAHFESQPDENALEQLGLDVSIWQKNPDDLSSGEKQRLALLRGLQYQPQVLLLDEITANLDAESTLRTENLLRDYLERSEKQAAILWISHSEQQIERMMSDNCHLRFDGGRQGEAL